MPARAKIWTDVPEDVRLELDGELIKRGFSGYHALAAWLLDRGHEISKTAIHRYAEKHVRPEYKKVMEQIYKERAYAKAVAAKLLADGGAMSAVNLAMLEHGVAVLLRQLHDYEGEQNHDKAIKRVGQMARTLLDIVRARTANDRHDQETEAKARALAEHVATSGQSLTPAELSAKIKDIFGV